MSMNTDAVWNFLQASVAEEQHRHLYLSVNPWPLVKMLLSTFCGETASGLLVGHRRGMNTYLISEYQVTMEFELLIRNSVT